MRRHPENPDFALRIFELLVMGVRGSKEVAKQTKRAQLWSAPARLHPDCPPTLFATVPAAPPEDILETTLLRHAKFTLNGCAEMPTEKSGRSAKLRPKHVAIAYPVSANHVQAMHLDCWLQDTPESFLEVDLGGTCNVTHVSTMGGYPPTEMHPSWELQMQWEREHSTPRCGQRGTFVKPDAVGWQQWVTKYELQARLDGGRSWETIGTLKGNLDMTAKVAHDLREFCHNPEGLKCRYLRVIPEACHGKPALRICVYGVGLEKQSRQSTKKSE